VLNDGCVEEWFFVLFLSACLYYYGIYCTDKPKPAPFRDVEYKVNPKNKFGLPLVVVDGHEADE
jgi:hypothetical protein